MPLVVLPKCIDHLPVYPPLRAYRHLPHNLVSRRHNSRPRHASLHRTRTRMQNSAWAESLGSNPTSPRSTIHYQFSTQTLTEQPRKEIKYLCYRIRGRAARGNPVCVCICYCYPGPPGSHANLQ